MCALLAGCSGTGGTGEPAGQVSVVAFNIAGWRIVHGGEQFSLDRQAALVKTLAPDVVCFQEVVRQSSKSVEYPDIDRVAEMARRLGFEHFAFYKPPDGKKPRWPHTYGLSIVSRWPIKQFREHALPIDDDPGYPRHLLAATIVPDNGVPPFVLCSLHLQHGDAGQDDREQAAKFINALYADSELPVILAGDFNARPDNDAMRILSEDGGWTDTTKLGIDAVLYRPADAWRTISVVRVPHEGASDHDPVRAVLQYTGPAGGR